jgi:chemotaxis signal transduction protein
MSVALQGCLLVWVGGRRVGLPLDLVVEVIEGGALQPVPTKERALLGVVSQRGRLVPVFSLAELLGRAPREGSEQDRDEEGTTLVMADVSGARVAYQVDAADVVVRTGITWLQADATLPWARAIVGLPDDGYVPLVDLALLRGDAEDA